MKDSKSISLSIFQPRSPCNYESMSNYLHLKMFNFRQQQFDASFLIKVFKNTINCCSVMDIVFHRVPSKTIRDFSTFKRSVCHSCKNYLEVSGHFQ
jgi:hypothetical protein